MAYDKLRMYEKMLQGNISIPKTYIFENNWFTGLASLANISIDTLDQELILKQRFSNGGKGIRLVSKNEGSYDSDVLFQEVMKNHNDIKMVQGNNFCSTLRYVFYNSNELLPIGATFQFNLGKIIDHMMQGGSVSVSVDVKTGKLFGRGIVCNGEAFKNHPVTGAAFVDFQLPNWNLVLTEIQKIAKSFPSLPLIAVELCICEYNCVVLEINAGCGTIAGQLNHGWLAHPFFDDYYPKRPIIT